MTGYDHLTTICLADGNTIPSLGLGTWKIPQQRAPGIVREAVRAGLVRHIGVCDFGTSLLRDLLFYAVIRPAVLQVELHPYLAHVWKKDSNPWRTEAATARNRRRGLLECFSAKVRPAGQVSRTNPL